MGCANSKQYRCPNCQAAHSPVRRSHSTIHAVHPPHQNGDSYHLVALTASALSSLSIDPSKDNIHAFRYEIDRDRDANVDNVDDQLKQSLIVCDDKKKKSMQFEMGLIEARTWSDLIDQKIPKVVPRTPVMTPPGEPETINTWELMEGLEDTSPLYLRGHFRSFSFDVSRGPSRVPDSPKLDLHQNGLLSPTNAGSRCIEFDPEVISAFRKSLEELSPQHRFYLKALDCGKEQYRGDDCLVHDTKKVETVDNCGSNKRGNDKVVVYFTSLRGVRKTYEDCCHVRMILKSLGVRVDERDVSMHSGFKEELKELMGEGSSGGGLPRVFVGGKYIGGAEEVQRMHEEGKLEKLVEGCEKVDDGGGGGPIGGSGACEACGDIRFVPCETCSGSCKIYYEWDEEQEQLECEESGEFGFQRCPDCNENGLIRCPICCD